MRVARGTPVGKPRRSVHAAIDTQPRQTSSSTRPPIFAVAGGPDAVSVMFKVAKRQRRRTTRPRSYSSDRRFLAGSTAGPAGDLWLDAVAQSVGSTSRSRRTRAEVTPAFKAAKQQRLDLLIRERSPCGRRARRGSRGSARGGDVPARRDRVPEVATRRRAVVQRGLDVRVKARTIRFAPPRSCAAAPRRRMEACWHYARCSTPRRSIRTMPGPRRRRVRAAGMSRPRRNVATRAARCVTRCSTRTLYFALGETVKATTALGILVKADRTTRPVSAADFAERAKDDARSNAIRGLRRRPAAAARGLLVRGRAAACRSDRSCAARPRAR